jgi:hypothetical protein
MNRKEIDWIDYDEEDENYNNIIEVGDYVVLSVHKVNINSIGYVRTIDYNLDYPISVIWIGDNYYSSDSDPWQRSCYLESELKKVDDMDILKELESYVNEDKAWWVGIGKGI